MGLLNGSIIIGIIVIVLSFLFLQSSFVPSFETLMNSDNNHLNNNNKVIVVGGGLAGLSAALEAHKQGATVILLEKESRLGGNSAKASSGINAVGTQAQKEAHSLDSIDAFVADTLSSGGGACQEDLVKSIVSRSSEAVSFLTSLGVDLSVLSKCGGHTYARTHRASPPPVGQPARNIGFEITSKLIDKVNQTKSIRVITGARVTKLLVSGGGVVEGVEYRSLVGEQGLVELKGAKAVIITTGGFAADRKPGGLLEKYGGAKLAHLPTTNGPWATGDGVKLMEDVNAKMVLMDQVQIHPTGFVDPKDPTNPTKFLAPEALRAVGGILVNKEGRRFVDELSLRSQVAPAIFKNGFTLGSEGNTITAAYMLLNDDAVNAFGPASLKFYMGKGFIVKYANVNEFATKVGIDEATLEQTITSYNTAAGKGGEDEFGKKTFPVTFASNEAINVLIVTPSIHYTMGGALINTEARVLGTNGSPISGLYAAGEASGGVHGNNRLAGNSLLECVVFGRIAGVNAALNK